MCFRELLPRTVNREEFLDQYVEALVNQIRAIGATRRFHDANCDSIFMGGGTASLLSLPQLTRLLGVMRKNLNLGEDVEITLEGNPTDFTTDYLAGLPGQGITRVSIGYQSGQQHVLDALGTIHNSEQGIAAVRAALDSDIPHVNVDLLYNVPGQSFEQWQQDLRFVLNQAPRSVSVGDYMVFPGTRSEYLTKLGKLPAQVSVEETYRWYQWATDELVERGYHEQVREMFCRPGAEQRYVWQCGNENREIVALGSGALGFINGVQFRNVDNSRAYKAAMNGSGAVFADQVSTPATEQMMMERYIIHNMYASEVGRMGFRNRFGVDITDRFGTVCERLVTTGLAKMDSDTLRLTDLGREWRKNVYYEFYSVRDEHE
jgi:oxygen-independent coproporphyrinogen-3 oxidase